MSSVQVIDGVLEIVMANPPVNALGAKLRKQLYAAVSDAQQNSAVKAIVVRGSGKFFSAGADISEFGKPPVEPTLTQVIDAIEASDKPVVAAIHGMALGGGLEVALACHYRMVTPEARLGLPEVKLGIIPGVGGTQRLPRLVGVERALTMIVSGEPVAGIDTVELGLADCLCDEATLATEAIDYARSIDTPRRTGDLAIVAKAGVFERFTESHTRKLTGLDAPIACVEAVKAAAELTLEQGLARERELFMKLLDGEQSLALRHVFRAERAAAKIDGLPQDTALRTIDRVGVIGAGTMGGGISMNFLSAGIPVTLLDMNSESLDRGVGIIRKNYETSAKKGRISVGQVDAAMQHLKPTLDFSKLCECDLIIEAVYEDIEIKKDIFRQLDELAKPGAILASNTSYLDINAMAAVTRRADDVVGLHFFSPANVMKLLEVVRAEHTADDVLATAMRLAGRIGKVPVVARVCHGFIGNRMLTPRQSNATTLVYEGASPQQIDQVHTAFGMPMGPFQMGDLAGLDIGWHRDPNRIESLKDALCAQNRWGQKTQAGYYDYDDNRRPTPSPLVQGIIEQYRALTGIVARDISEEEIIARTLYTMVNEGAKILDEGIAQRASDIDVVWNHGYGWPRHKGGPMFWAEQVGLNRIVAELERYADRMGPTFTLSPLLKKRAAVGSFD